VSLIKPSGRPALEFLLLICAAVAADVDTYRHVDVAEQFFGYLASREPDVQDWDLMAFDDELARMVWRRFSPLAQAVFSVLMDNPGEAIPADELAARIGLANGRHGLAGVVAWPSRQCAEVHRLPLFRYEAAEKPGESGAYWMDPRTAKLFLAARDSYSGAAGRSPRSRSLTGPNARRRSAGPGGLERHPRRTAATAAGWRYSFEMVVSFAVRNSSRAGRPSSVAAIPRFSAATISPGSAIRSA